MSDALRASCICFLHVPCRPPLLEALKGAVCKEQLAPRPMFRQGLSLAAGVGRDVFPAENLQPRPPLILMKKCVSCCNSPATFHS